MQADGRRLASRNTSHGLTHPRDADDLVDLGDGFA